MGKLDFLHYAENDYKFVAETYKAGIHCRETMLAIVKTLEMKRLSEKENEEIDFGI